MTSTYFVFCSLLLSSHAFHKNHNSPLFATVTEGNETRRFDSPNNHNRPEHQNSLPLIRHKILLPQRNRTKHQLAPRKINTQRHRPVPHQREPARHPASHRRISPRRQHRRPVVDASRGGVDSTDLGERCRDAKGDEGNEDPAPEDGDGLTVSEGDVHGCGEAEGDGHDGEGPVVS